MLKAGDADRLAQLLEFAIISERILTDRFDQVVDVLTAGERMLMRMQYDADPGAAAFLEQAQTVRRMAIGLREAIEQGKRNAIGLRKAVEGFDVGAARST